MKTNQWAMCLTIACELMICRPSWAFDQNPLMSVEQARAIVAARQQAAVEQARREVEDMVSTWLDEINEAVQRAASAGQDKITFKHVLWHHKEQAHRKELTRRVLKELRAKGFGVTVKYNPRPFERPGPGQLTFRIGGW